MQTTTDTLSHQYLPGERQRLKIALLTDQDGILTTTRMRLIRLARARGIEAQAIDDVVQETLLEAWGHLERLYSPEGFHLWIDEICRNVCRRYTHKQQMNLLRNVPMQHSPLHANDEDAIGEQDVFPDFPDFTLFDPLEALSRQDEVLLLDKALRELPQAARQLVEMCYLLELSRTEVATHLGISSGALETRLHRTRRQLRHIFNGPLREEALGLGMKLDDANIEGWQETRLWCPLCAKHRLQGCFIYFEVETEGPNLHLRCPGCSQHYGQDTVRSMGLVSLAGLHAFRPAWKRTMQGLTDRVVQALSRGNHPCLYCGQPALIQVQGEEAESASPGSPYSYWIYLQCPHCGRCIDTSGCIPSVDQIVCWSHPRTRQFVQHHPHPSTTPGRLAEYNGQSAIHFQITDAESNDHLEVLVHRHTLSILSLV
jgi:RNA polymerase sigma-70 factor (ECF subfamily)